VEAIRGVVATGLAELLDRSPDNRGVDQRAVGGDIDDGLDAECLSGVEDAAENVLAVAESMRDSGIEGTIDNRHVLFELGRRDADAVERRDELEPLDDALQSGLPSQVNECLVR
jgi:hypothetical protein